MSQSPEPPPAPPSGNRGLAAALAVVLGVGFVTCVYSSIQAVKALIVARSDLQVVTVIRDADRTLVEVLQENIQGKADTDTAVQRLDGSTKNLDPDLLQDLVEKNAEVLALLDAPSGELTKTRSTNQIPLLAQTLRAVGSTLLPTIQDPALKSNTREYTFRSRDGNTGSKADQELEQVVEGAKSLYSSARARLLVSLSGALIIFLALGYLGWRRWGPFRASRHRLRRSLSRQPKHEEEPTAPPPEPISPPKTAPPDLVPSFSAPAKPPRPSRPQFDATTADTDTPDTGSQARPQPTPAGPPPRKPLRFRETEDTTLNVATVRPAAPRALRPSSAPRLPDIPLLAGTSIERPLTPTPTPTPVPAPIPVRTAAPPRPVQPVRPFQPI
ncbi:MAG: hypothetical protein LBO75_05260, partial [Bifidobacteriaceae bacterium]|nr:hypothetical protein [Bifidobacteriaceae bacterium]